MSDLIRRLPTPDRGAYAQALNLLAVAEGPDGGPPGHAIIAHIDSGVAPHEGIGWPPGTPAPAWLLLSRGRNFVDGPCDQFPPPPPGIDATAVCGMERTTSPQAGLIEYPDHGVKTLSALCGPIGAPLQGAAPGVRVIPYRVSNGPLFYEAEGDIAGPAMQSRATERLGWAIEHALAQDPQPGVMSISMGNPGFAGIFEPIRAMLGGEMGMAPNVAPAVNRAYEAGVILCCAAGQVIDGVIFPARWDRTIGVSGYDIQGTGGQCRHYPPGGYRDRDAERWVDIHAQAMRINRAGFDMRTTPPRPNWAEDTEEDEPSGTSYATPQVAAAAALWRTWHAAELERLFGAPADRWKIVEAFRWALKDSAAEMQADMPPARHGPRWKPIPTLDIPALLNRAPSAAPTLEKRPPAG